MKKLFSLLLAILLLALFPAAMADDPFAGMTWYSEGQYKVGLDMKAGEYVCLSTSSYSGYFCISSDANARNIICNDNFTTNSIITVQYGDFVQLSRCIAVKADDFYQEYRIADGKEGVMLRVGYGYDIMPGTYKLRATSSTYSGYYCIYHSSRQDKIIANDLFTNTSYVTVTSGQYLVLDRCQIVN